ncbi:hypothetical protein [Streptomyces coeruleorubidus]|uniref:hypothetical protein n=1 Tax=Streptomyces coeruleorubidus TaxID=116188 RepID=UPI0037A252B5
MAGSWGLSRPADNRFSNRHRRTPASGEGQALALAPDARRSNWKTAFLGHVAACADLAELRVAP